MTRTGIIFLAALAVGLIACPSPGHAKVPKLLEPNGDWTVSRESGVCSAKRSFGEGRETTDLMLQSVGPSRSFLFTVRGFPLQKNKYKKARVRFSFGPDRYSHWHFAAYFATDSEGKGVFRAQDSLADWKERRERGDDHLSFAPDDPRDNSFWQIDEKREAEVDRLTLEGPVAQPVTLHTGVFTEPLGLLRECVARQF
ncbi:MAG TPA: hypothetical protein VLA37_04165, partial [Sphingomonadaceae bacterium]|nr:hypothetical protein [Sphingomonadaceae bacterium]